MTKQELIKHIEGYPENEVFAAHLWSTEDVIGHAKANRINISLKEAAIILETIERHIDSECGLTWDTINNAVIDFDIERNK